jgi:hypothetical protein
MNDEGREKVLIGRKNRSIKMRQENEVTQVFRQMVQELWLGYI